MPIAIKPVRDIPAPLSVEEAAKHAERMKTQQFPLRADELRDFLAALPPAVTVAPGQKRNFIAHQNPPGFPGPQRTVTFENMFLVDPATKKAAHYWVMLS